ncbi:MAG: molybdate transport system substrate-binding protein [Candidatus Azotimanducaceae bacterium]
MINSRGTPVEYRDSIILMIMRKMLLIAVCCSAVQGALAESINVAVAANFVSTFKLLAADFEVSSGHTLKISSGSSGRFYAQIKNGAPFYVFFSADQSTPQRLEAEGLVVAGSRLTYAVGALALWSANPRLVVDGVLDGAQVLHGGDFNKLALANPRLAPYGVAALEVLTALGLREANRNKWVQGENIAQTYQFVSTGNADVGFVALSQVSQISKLSQTREAEAVRGAAWLVPAELYQPIMQDAVLLRRGETSQAAHALLRYVRGAEARVIIEANGYRWPAP